MAKFTVDFSGVEDKTITPGKYAARIVKITREEGAKAPYLKWELQILSGECKGLHINHITSLSPSALFGLRDTLIALGVNVPKSAIAIDPDKLVGRTLGIEVFMRKTDDGNEYANVKKTFALEKGVATAVAPVSATASAPAETEVVLDLE